MFIILKKKVYVFRRAIEQNQANDLGVLVKCKAILPRELFCLSVTECVHLINYHTEVFSNKPRKNILPKP